MLLSTPWSLYYQDNDFWILIRSAAITFAVGAVFWFFSRGTIRLNIKDWFTIGTLGCVIASLFCALPIYLSGYLPHFYDAVFESISGLTTTGATVLGSASTRSIEELPHGILFWRSLTQFIGGFGTLIFSIAILPLHGMNSLELSKADVAGPISEKVTPRVRQTTKALASVYVALVLLETLFLKLAGMTLFESFCHSFATLSTGGFSTSSANIGFFNSGPIEWILILFMIIAATNFTFHHRLLTRRSFIYFKDKEFRTFIWFIALLFLILLFDGSARLFGFSFATVRNALFTTVSMLSTTGFYSSDYNLWPNLTRTLIFLMFFLGGMTASTAGGLKMIRSIIVFKYLKIVIKKMLHPQAVYPLTIGGKIIHQDAVRNTVGFYLIYIVVFVIVSILFAALGLDLTTSISASASSLGNIGPGFGSIGPFQNWGHFPESAKWLASFCMLLGRLELFAVIILFSRSYWEK